MISVHDKLNCITVNFDKQQHGIYKIRIAFNYTNYKSKPIAAYIFYDVIINLSFAATRPRCHERKLTRILFAGTCGHDVKTLK